MYRLKLANIMGMDTDNAQHGVGIADALTGIEEPAAFIEYCRDKKNGIEYENRIEKLDTLATMYKKLQENIKLPHDTAKAFSKQLANKVKQTRNIVEEKNIVFSMLKVDGEKFFTQKELNALQGLGSIIYIIEASRQNTLEDQLRDLFLGKYIAKSKYTALTDNQKKIQEMARITP